MPSDFTSILNVKTFKQYCQYIEGRERGTCPLCDERSRASEKLIRTSRDASWRIWHARFPAPHSATHLVIAPVRHLTHPEQMSDKDWKALSELTKFAIMPAPEGLGLPGGGVLMRFGNPDLNAGSIRHIHANIIVPDGTGEVRLPLAKDPSDIAKKKQIIEIFEKLRQGITFQELPTEQQELVKNRLG